MTVTETMVERAKLAIRDEIGSMLCCWIEGERKCQTAICRACWCETIARAALTAALSFMVVVDSMRWLGGDYQCLQKFCGLNFGRADAHDVDWLGPDDGEQVVIWNTAMDQWLCCPKGFWIDRRRDGALFPRSSEPSK